MTEIHVGDTVKFRDRSQDAYGEVTALDNRGDELLQITEEGTVKPFLIYAAAVTVIRCPHCIKPAAWLGKANRHDYQPTEAVGNPCEVCGFDRHHPWHA